MVTNIILINHFLSFRDKQMHLDNNMRKECYLNAMSSLTTEEAWTMPFPS